MAAAFGGRDTWKYSVVAVIAGTVLLFIGAIMSYRYLGAVVSDRGALRRRRLNVRPPEPEKPAEPDRRRGS
jgi:hypothetical protein